MKIVVRYGLILGVICLLSAGLLALVNAITQPKIFAQIIEEENRTLLEVLPEAASFEPVEDVNKEVIYYKGFNKDKTLVGVAFKAQGKGYSSTIETMAGINLDGKINAIKVTNQSETPGLGVRITENSFRGQFKGKAVQDLSRIQAIAGATISSKAVIDSVKEKSEEVLKLLKNGK